MLTKRTNILFSENLWEKVALLAREKNMSVGELIRTTLENTYFNNSKNKKLQKAYRQILTSRKRYKKINYKKLINYGRKI